VTLSGWWALLFRGVAPWQSLPLAERRLCCCSRHQAKLEVLVEPTENGKLLVRVSGWIVAGIFLREDRLEQFDPARVPVVFRAQAGVATGRATRVDSPSPQEALPEAIER
jgi:hypothetical protein